MCVCVDGWVAGEGGKGPAGDARLDGSCWAQAGTEANKHSHPHRPLCSRRPAAAKQKELAELQRSGQARKVGPAAAKSLLELLTATNPDLPINPADV